MIVNDITIPDIAPILTHEQQQLLYKVDDKVLIRPDAKLYTRDFGETIMTPQLDKIGEILKVDYFKNITSIGYDQMYKDDEIYKNDLCILVKVEDDNNKYY
jgi:hypothetical protein